MRFYDSKDSINIVQPVASASTMISSVAIEAKKYILSKFPKGYFKHVYIDTAQTVSEQNRNERYNANANKIPYPSMTISPEISLDDPIGGMEKGAHLSSPNLYLRRDIQSTYRKLVIDPDNRFSIYYTSDYITTNFNFKLVTNTYIQNADLAFFLKSNFQKDFFQFLNHRGIQSEIPKTFIRTIADIHNWDLNNSDQMDQLRLYLIATSKQEDAIQKRTNLATGKQCFFLNEKQNFLVLFTDLDCPPSINRDSQSESDYTITFRLQISVWLPNAYIMSLSKKMFTRLQQKTKDELNSPEDDLQEQGIITRAINWYKIKNDIRFQDKQGNQQIGQLIYNDTFVYNLQDTIPLIDILNKLPYEVRQAYQYGLYKTNLDMSQLLYFFIYIPGEGIISNENIEFDYNNPDGGLRVTQESDDGIGIAVYLNRLLFESIKVAMIDDKDFFAQNKLALMDINFGNNQTVKVIVKSFTNDNDIYSSDPEKCLRVKTGFGIGYISLINEKKTKKNAYKICIGFEDDGTPIIREFETEK